MVSHIKSQSNFKNKFHKKNRQFMYKKVHFFRNTWNTWTAVFSLFLKLSTTSLFNPFKHHTMNECASKGNYFTYYWTGRQPWGIVYYVNGRLIPEIVLKRGEEYHFIIETGDDETNTAEYHPVYISTDPDGGYTQKNSSEKAVRVKYAHFWIKYFN